MTDNTVPPGSADLPLAVRQRIERENEQAIRDGIRHRYFHLSDEECAIDRNARD